MRLLRWTTRRRIVAAGTDRSATGRRDPHVRQQVRAINGSHGVVAVHWMFLITDPRRLVIALHRSCCYC